MDEIEELERLAAEHERENTDQRVDQPNGNPEKGSEADYQGLITDGLDMLEKCFQLIDDRFFYDDKVKGEGQKELTPLLEKYRIGEAAAEKAEGLPFFREVIGGLFIGRLIKYTVGLFRAIKAHDNEKKEKREKQSKNEPSNPQQGSADPYDVLVVKNGD